MKPNELAALLNMILNESDDDTIIDLIVNNAEELEELAIALAAVPKIGDGKPDAPTHTPGPWHIGDTNKNHPAIVYASDGWVIANTSGVICRTDDEESANARLIAAAPGMLEALETVAACKPDHSGGVTLGHVELSMIADTLLNARS